MNVLKNSFIYFLITITDFNNMDGPGNTHQINNTFYSTPDCNQEFWDALLTLLQTDNNNIKLMTFTDKYPDIKEDIQALYKHLCDDDVLHFYDINRFLFKLNSEDYTTLMSYLTSDGLDTPSDWSSIGSSDEDLEDIVISFNINDTVHSPIHAGNPEVAKDTENTEDTMVAAQQVEQILDASPDNNPIMEAPKAIRFYDPSIIPPREFHSKPKNYCAYCNDPPHKYSWYMSLILNCAEWIKVPNWVRKYF
jgi:hypothetical protein